jgi:peptidoglycan/xylan/chitin deacetylase (PgdA/CDA1 family)
MRSVISAPRGIRVLAYHAIRELPDDPLLAPYSVPPSLFEEHLDSLTKDRYEFLSPGAFVEILQGQRASPRLGVLLTFDDCYKDLLDAAVPMLEARGIPAAAFVVTRRVGGTNEWDAIKGAASLPLLDADGLSAAAARGIELGLHSRTHPVLTELTNDGLDEEIAGGLCDFGGLGLPRPRLLAYPYGGHDERVRRAVRRAGIPVAFTSDAGLARAQGDLHRVPRVGIKSSDVGWRFRAKVALAGRIESDVARWATRAARALARGGR